MDELERLKREHAERAMKDHWAKKVGVSTPEEQRLLDGLVNASSNAFTIPAAMTSTGGSFNALEARVKTLEARVKTLERALSEAGKSEWDRFEELVEEPKAIPF